MTINWKKCSDGQPVEPGFYWVTHFNSRYDYDVCKAFWANGRWFDEDIRAGITDIVVAYTGIIALAEMPEPYEEKE